MMRELQTRATGFNFHHRDLKFSDIVSNTLIVMNLKTKSKIQTQRSPYVFHFGLQGILIKMTSACLHKPMGTEYILALKG